MVLVSSSVVLLEPFFHINSSNRSRDGRAILREQVVLLLLNLQRSQATRRGRIHVSFIAGQKFRLNWEKIKTLECFLGKKNMT